MPTNNIIALDSYADSIYSYSATL